MHALFMVEEDEETEVWDWTFGIIVSRKRERAGFRSSKKLCKSHSKVTQSTNFYKPLLTKAQHFLLTRRITFRRTNIA